MRSFPAGIWGCFCCDCLTFALLGAICRCSSNQNKIIDEKDAVARPAGLSRRAKPYSQSFRG